MITKLDPNLKEPPSTALSFPKAHFGQFILSSHSTTQLPALTMPQVNATLEYLQNLPLYDVEKPYWCFFAPRDGFDPNLQRLDNLEFEAHENIPINDLRDLTKKADINECGFQVVPHLSMFFAFDSIESIWGYKVEIE